MKNFLSFDDEAQFDMFPNMKRTQLAGHVYTDLCDVPLLKQAAIYGSNGAGKSNVVKAMEFLRAFALDKDFAKNLELGKFFYLLKEDAGKEPISLAVEFEIQQHFFFYEVELTETFVAKEGLYESFPKEGKLDLIYERKQEEVEFAQAADEAIAEATRKMLEKNPLASLMALNREFPIIADARCALAAQWFNGQLEIIGVHTFLPTLIDLLRDNQPMMEFVRQLVSSLEVGVNDMTLQETDFDSWAKQHIAIAQNLPGDLDKVKSLSLNANTTPVLSINVENGVRKVYQLIFDNIGKGGFVGSLDTSMQSDGTLRALTLLPALYYACKQGKTVVVDEINCCLSPTMVKGIVEYFAKTADTNGQLIFTTHVIADMFTQLDYMEKRGSGLCKMRELTEKLPNFLPGKEPHYKTEASSFFTTFYNLNWGENGRISVEEVADRVNSTLKKYPVNGGASERKFGVNADLFGANNKNSVEKFGVSADKFGDTLETPKKVSKTAQKIIDLVISDPSITADNMANKVGVTKRAIEKNIKSLRDMGILTHEGSDKSGYWRIIVKP